MAASKVETRVASKAVSWVEPKAACSVETMAALKAGLKVGPWDASTAESKVVH